MKTKNRTSFYALSAWAGTLHVRSSHFAIVYSRTLSKTFPNVNENSRVELQIYLHLSSIEVGGWFKCDVVDNKTRWFAHRQRQRILWPFSTFWPVTVTLETTQRSLSWYKRQRKIRIQEHGQKRTHIMLFAFEPRSTVDHHDRRSQEALHQTRSFDRLLQK